MAENNYKNPCEAKREISYMGREAYDAFCRRFSKATHSKLEDIDKWLARSIANGINKVVL